MSPRSTVLLAAGFCSMLASGCSSSADDAAEPEHGTGGAPPAVIGGDPFDVPLRGASREQTALFNHGDVLFGLSLRNYDGLGPLYTRSSCSSCHTEAARGPGFVQKMSVVESDGVTAAADQSLLAFGSTVHPLVTAGATTPIVPPADEPRVKVTTRVGPSVLGRGYMEAVLDSEIERMAEEQSLRSDGIRGRVNRVVYGSEPNPDTSFHSFAKGDAVIGRFGLKARIATLDEFTADALQGDMGITSPLRPEEFPNPDGLDDDLKPGVDVSIASVNDRANYMRLIAIPKRPALAGEGYELFAAAKCDVCHAPSLHTRANYPIELLADIDAPIFTDMLLHDMGDALADGTRDTDGQATSRDWRTTPLIGVRFNNTLMHDGRAHDARAAILAHAGKGSEANGSVDLFEALSEAEQATLLEFVESL